MAKNSKNKYTGSWWHSQISNAEDRHKKFFEQCQESIKVYKAEKDLSDTQRRLNVWWYIVNTLLPAYYSSTPKAEVNLRKRVGGLKYELGAVILERNTQFSMDEHFDFDTVGYNAALQFLLTGRSVLWARYEAEFEKELMDFALIRNEAGILVNAQGMPFEGDEATLVTTPEGIIIGQMEIEVKDDERAILENVHYNDFLTADARSESEIEWKAKRAFLTKYQAEEKFGSDVAKNMKFDSYPEILKSNYWNDSSKYEGKAELWEIWCKESDKVYWLQKNGDQSMLEEGEPPVEYEGFWPCSVISQSTDPNSVIPVSDYVHAKDQILEVERITTRLAATVQAVRTNALYDATMGVQVEQLLQGDLKYIPVNNWPSYKGRGGQANGIEYLDIRPYVEAISVLQAARTEALNQLYETLKVSDLLRGTSAEYKTATANRLENAWSSLGLIVRQNQFAKFISDGVNKLGTIIAENFSAETLFAVSDADNLIGQLLPEQADPIMRMQQLEMIKGDIIDVLQDDEDRIYRIVIATDSMVALDQAQDKQDGLQLLETCGQFFEQLKSMTEAYPPLAGFGMELMQNMIRRFKGGKELDGLFTKALGDVRVIADQKSQQAQQAPSDPLVLQVEQQREAAQIKAQLEMQRMQMDAQEMQQKAYMAQLDAQARMAQSQAEVEVAYRKAQLDEFIAQQNAMVDSQKLQLEQQRLQLEMMKIQSETAVKADSTEAKREADRVAQIIDLQRLELENMAVRMKESEKLLEERRLNQEQELEKLRLAAQTQMQIMQPPPVAQQAPSEPVVINNIVPQQKWNKRVGKIVTDADGNPSIEIFNVES